MVASQKEYVMRPFDLVGQQQSDSLNRLLTSVHIVSYEQELIVSFGITCHFKQSKEVKVLTMHITENFDGSLQL